MALVAYYDLKLNPPTFSFLDFLLAAEVERIELKEDELDVKILLGPEEGFRKDDRPPFGANERFRWLRNIAMPMPLLLKSCRKAAEIVNRVYATNEPEFGRDTYTAPFNLAMEAAKKDIFPFEADEGLTESFKEIYGQYITITLCERSWRHTRRSDINEWIKVSEEIESTSAFKVVFIRDVGEDDKGQLRNFHTDHLSARHLTARAALYSGAVSNIGVAGGPLWFCLFLGVPAILFHLIHEHRAQTPRAWTSYGLEPYSQFPNARPGQILVWKKDNADIILDSLKRAGVLHRG